MISIVSNNMIRFNIKSIANYLLFPKNEVHYIGGAEILPAPLRGGNLALDASG